MGTASVSDNPTVRINDLDWRILRVMSDGDRYTPSYLGKDRDEFNDYKASYVRRRVTDLYGNELIDKVGTSSMYIINERGRAALDLRDEGVITDDTTPRELRQLISERAGEMSDRDTDS